MRSKRSGFANLDSFCELWPNGRPLLIGWNRAYLWRRCVRRLALQDGSVRTGAKFTIYFLMRSEERVSERVKGIEPSCPWERCFLASDSHQTPRRAKSDFLSVHRSLMMTCFSLLLLSTIVALRMQSPGTSPEEKNSLSRIVLVM